MLINSLQTYGFVLESAEYQQSVQQLIDKSQNKTPVFIEGLTKKGNLPTKLVHSLSNVKGIENILLITAGPLLIGYEYPKPSASLDLSQPYYDPKLFLPSKSKDVAQLEIDNKQRLSAHNLAKKQLNQFISHVTFPYDKPMFYMNKTSPFAPKNARFIADGIHTGVKRPRGAGMAKHAQRRLESYCLMVSHTAV